MYVVYVHASAHHATDVDALARQKALGGDKVAAGKLIHIRFHAQFATEGSASPRLPSHTDLLRVFGCPGEVAAKLLAPPGGPVCINGQVFHLHDIYAAHFMIAEAATSPMPKLMGPAHRSELFSSTPGMAARQS